MLFSRFTYHILLYFITIFSPNSIKCSEDLLNEEHYTDLFGYKVNWTDFEDGWNEDKRINFLQIQTRNELQPKLVPKFTESGYEKRKIPENLYYFILERRNVLNQLGEQCPYSQSYQNCYRLKNGEKFERKNSSVLLALNGNENTFKNVLITELGPMLEEWIGGEIPLEFGQMYGIRRYRRGASLALHVDKLISHVVSAIMQIDQSVDEDWPLLLVDHSGQKVKVNLRPGEMLFYESAKILHGRQIPLNGTYFDNLFIHFKPKSGLWYEEDFSPDLLSQRIVVKDDLIKWK